jgi:hypothetical protein
MFNSVCAIWTVKRPSRHRWCSSGPCSRSYVHVLPESLPVVVYVWSSCSIWARPSTPLVLICKAPESSLFGAELLITLVRLGAKSFGTFGTPDPTMPVGPTGGPKGLTAACRSARDQDRGLRSDSAPGLSAEGQFSTRMPFRRGAQRGPRPAAAASDGPGPGSLAGSTRKLGTTAT